MLLMKEGHKEFFLLIMRELLDPKYGMFRYYEDSRLIWFSDKVKSPAI